MRGNESRFWLTMGLAALLLRAAVAGVVVQEDFSTNPITNSRATVVGDATRFAVTTGALTAHYDTQLATTKLLWNLGQTFTDSESFQANTTFTINSANFSANPNQSAQIALGFANSVTTGTDRGGAASGQVKAFDTVSIDYFPNISPTWGGPTLSPTIIQTQVAGVGYFSSIHYPQAAESLLDDPGESDLPRDGSLKAVLKYDAPTRGLTVTLTQGLTPLALNTIGGSAGLPGGTDGDITTIQMTLSPSAAFSVDRFGLLLWQDSWNTAGKSVVGDLTFNRLTVSTPSVWAGNGADGKWSTAANWTTGVPANETDLLLGALTGTQATVNNDLTGRTVSAIRFLSGADSLTLAGNSLTVTGPISNESSNAQSITAGLSLVGRAGVIDTGSAALTLGGAVTGSVTLTKQGTGQLTLTGPWNYDGGVKVTAGKLKISGVGNRIGSLSIDNSGETLGPPPSGGYTGPIRTYYGTFDLANGSLVVASGNLAEVTDQLRAGQNGATGGKPNWTGVGLTSSTAAETASAKFGAVGIGAIRNDQNALTTSIEGPLYTTFNGISNLTGGEILLKYTYYGDCDLDGRITSFDFSLLDAGLAGTVQTDGLPGWYFGDVNYDGVIDATDRALINAGYAAYSTAGGGQLPEPGSCALLIAGIIVGGVGRRRGLFLRFRR